MAKREAVLRMLGEYEDQLAQGVLPNDLKGVLTEHVVYSHLAYSPSLHRDVENPARCQSAQKHRAKLSGIEDKAEYEIGVFAKEHLLLKPDDVELSSDEVEDNRRRLQDYRKQLESQGV